MFMFGCRIRPSHLSSHPEYTPRMKTAFTLLLTTFLILACGCTSAATPATTPALPDLRGTWTGPMQGYDEGIGFSEYPFLTMDMVIEEQHGRLFSGHMLFNANGTKWTTEIAGAIGRDNRTLSMVEKDGGYCFGEVLAEDEIDLTYVQDGPEYSIAVDYLKRK